MRDSRQENCAKPQANEPRPAIIETPRGTVEYSSYGGEGDASERPVILAIHGAMGGHDQGLILAHSAVGGSGFRIVSVSRPGSLGTPLTSGQTPEEQADLCASLLDALGIRKAAVIAISGGGQCALQFALRYPERCWALIMVSACSAQLTVRLPLRFHLMKLIARSPALVAFMRRKLESDPEKAAAEAIPDAALRARVVQHPEVGPLFRALQSSTLERLRQRMPGTLNDIKQSRSPFAYPLELIQSPTLVVHGTADEMAPFAHAQALASRVPGAEFLAIQGGEHVSLFTHREEIRARVTEFLTRHASVVAQASAAGD